MGGDQGGLFRVAQGGAWQMIKRQVLPAFFGGLLFMGMLNFWQAFLPVTVFMKAIPIEKTATSYTAKVTGYKIRNCPIVANSFVGWFDAGSGWHETAFDFPKDLTPNSSKPSGVDRQSFGLWRWVIPANAKRVRMTAQHDCNGEIRTSTFGPYSVSG